MSYGVTEGGNMLIDKRTKWTEEAEVVVVGYGGAGAVTAIAAHDAGAKVLILEKQPSDTPTQTRHTPSTRMSGGSWFCPTNLEKTMLYIEGMAKIANETWDAERKEMFDVVTHYLADNTEWMIKIGVELGGNESISPTVARLAKGGIIDGKVFVSDFPELPGSLSAPASHSPSLQGITGTERPFSRGCRRLLRGGASK